MELDELALGKAISYSELSTFMQCPTKHHYSYVERLRKTSFYMSYRIDIGIIVHESLEAALKHYYRTNYEATIEEIFEVVDARIAAYVIDNKPPKPVSEFEGFEVDDKEYNREIAQWEETVETARQIAKRTLQHLDVPHNWRTETISWAGEVVPLIEFRFEYPLVEDRNIVGKIDWIARSLKDDKIYLIDWKTRGNFTDDFSLAGEDMNVQLSIYEYVMMSLGIDIFGTITYQIKSAIPAVPALTKPKVNSKGEVTEKGHVSRAKIATDYPTLMKALLDNEEDISSYQEMLDNVQTEDYWFLPIYIFRGRMELFNRWQTVQAVAKQMVNTEQPIKYESPQCMYCPFFKLCLGEDRGLDTDHLKELSYTKSTYQH